MTVAATNALTARFASIVDGTQTVLSGAGVYPLLSLLAEHAAGPARDELLAVAPSPADFGLADSPTTRLAEAVWSRDELPLTERWLAAVPESMRGRLTGDPAVDQPVLDEWAARHTGGMIPAMPIRVNDQIVLVLASALAVLTTWSEPFTDGRSRPQAGPWRGRDLAALHRRTYDLGAARVAGTAAGPVTLLTVQGSEDVDVVLALGEPERGAAQVLPAAITALPDPSALDLAQGPGVRVEVVPARDEVPELSVSTVRFTVKGDHDLLEHADVFGLSTARDATTGHFPGISPVPLAISQARQSAVATFSATGFKAAAVTAMAMLVGSAAPIFDKQKQRVSVNFDRPFGFLAVYRPTGLVLVAGWVTDPDPHQNDGLFG